MHIKFDLDRISTNCAIYLKIFTEFNRFRPRWTMEGAIVQSRFEGFEIHINCRTQTVTLFWIYAIFRPIFIKCLKHFFFVRSVIHSLVCNFIQKRYFMNGFEIEKYRIPKMQLRLHNISHRFSLINADKIQINSVA